jgi:hypothetical protein
MHLLNLVAGWETGLVRDDPGVALISCSSRHQVAWREIQNAGDRAVRRALLEVVELFDNRVKRVLDNLFCRGHKNLAGVDERLDLTEDSLSAEVK